MSSFNFAQAQRDADTINEFVAARFASLVDDGSRIQRYADAISAMDTIDALTFLWLIASDPNSLSILPPLE